MSDQRRLAAILVADVVGYSRLVGQDEAGTLTRLRTLKSEVIDPSIRKHSGRLFKSVGDGFLVEFASAVQAVTAARAIQKTNAGGGLPPRRSCSLSKFGYQLLSLIQWAVSNRKSGERLSH